MATIHARNPFRLLRRALTLALLGLLAASFGMIIVVAGHGAATGFHFLEESLRELPTVFSASRLGVILQLSLVGAVAFGVLAVLVPPRHASAALMLASTIGWLTAAICLIKACRTGSLALCVISAAPFFAVSLAAAAFAVACLVLRERAPATKAPSQKLTERTA